MKKLAIISAIILSSLLCPVMASGDRPVNFIFLIDVSGSMLYKSEMVTASDGTQVTLFEALRQALEQIVKDPRLINASSKTSFITFGTKITDKSDWPTSIDKDQTRQLLLQNIHSADSLSADKHGDTYMGGALSLAIDKAAQLNAQTDPCTTTFIVMLTDGWDEPPPGATIKVREVAARLTQKQKEVYAKLGVNTWKVLVIGLQRLPDKKAGTTTAKELAQLLGGQFLDVTKQTGGTVSERIFSSLKQQVELLKGELSFEAGENFRNGILDFGTVSGNGSAKANLPVSIKSCYAEEVTGVQDVTKTIQSAQLKTVLKSAADASLGSCQPASNIAANAISVSLLKPQYQITPETGPQGERKQSTAQIELAAQAHTNCPAGHFLGCLKLTSSAKVPEFIPFVLRVPGRIVVEPEEINASIRKPGFFWAEPTDVNLIAKLKELPGSHAQANYNVTVVPETAVSNSEGKHSTAGQATIDSEQINHGKPVTFALDTSQSDSHEFKLNIAIPAKQKPGKYAGRLTLKIAGPPETVGPSEVPYQIVVEASPWEEIAPIAIPMFALLVISCVFGLILWLKNLRRD